MAGQVVLRLLGPIELLTDQEVVQIEGVKRRQAFAVLAAAGGDAVSEQRLIEALWGEHPPETATASLQSHISRLRQAIRPLTVTTVAAGYALDLGEADIDAARFEQLFERARDSSGPEAVSALAAALDLWRGAAFGEFAELPGVRGESLRLDELRLVATEEWIAARLADGESSALVADLESLVVDHPLRERFWLQLMLALHGSGRQGEALRRADRFRRILGDELGLSPSAGFQAIEASIVADEPRRPPQPADHQAPAATQRAVPHDTTSLIGRDGDVGRILEAVRPGSVVTVSGPGGIGKTRVALRVADAASDRFEQGVAVVELARVREPSAVVEIVAEALDLQRGQQRSLTDTVADYLAGQEVLLVLDNCEHVIDSVAELVDRLRRSSLRAAVLATSREPLGLPDEHVHLLAPLPTPDRNAEATEIAGFPAVELFVERAAAARRDFVLDAGNTASVAEICRRLDGLPLAIELAAARVRTLGPEALADRIDQRFTLLAGERRGSDERHHTLRSVVEWSHALLEPSEQQVFAQLSVFAGSFGLDAAESVCRLDGGEPVVGPLLNLVDKSMVRLVDADEPRYLVLETLREYGLEQLRATARQPEVEARHRSWYLEVARQAEAGIDSAEERRWVEQLDREFDNLRAAHVTAVRSGDLDVAARLVTALREYAFRRIRYEVTTLAEVTMSMDGYDRHRSAPLVAAVAAYGHWVRGDLDPAVALADRSVELRERCGADGSGLAERVLGNAGFFQGRIDEAARQINRMVDTARSGGSPAQLAHALYMASVAATSVDEPERGRALADEAIGVAELVGSPSAAAQAAYAVGLAMRAEDSVAAEQWLHRSSELAAAGGNRWVRAFALTEVHWLTARRGELLAGLAGYADVIESWLRGGDWANLWLSLRHVFGILVQLDAHTAAAVLHGKLLASGAASALPFEPADAERLVAEAERVAGVLGSAAFEAAVDRGRSMTDSAAVAHVRAEITRLLDPAS